MRLAAPPASVADTLRAARALIETPARWTQGMYAKDEQGQEIDPRDPAARQWCTSGAIGAVVGYGPSAIGARQILRKAAGARTMSIFNDDPARTHPEVMAAFDRAIALAEQQP
jgi:hypothetical protein